VETGADLLPSGGGKDIAIIVDDRRREGIDFTNSHALPGTTKNETLEKF
jgi:hypothetical protein